MNCEEFEAVGLDARRDGAVSEAERAAALEHASFCAGCAALQDSWQAAGTELHVFAEATQSAMTPARVEMRLRQEFRTRHQPQKIRRAALVGAWALATAAVLVSAMSWWNWRAANREGITRETKLSPGVSVQPTPAVPSGEAPADASESTITVADNDAGPFTLLPGNLETELDDAAVFRVNMQRGALGALGFPVNEEQAGEWVHVDLLMGDDGLPRGVRLPQ